MADADYEQDLSRQCMAKRPDQKMWDCNKTKGHRGCHVAYGGVFNGPSLPQWEWHDGDTVSVKAGQMKPMSAVTPAPTYQWTTVPTMPTAPMALWLNWCRCGNSWSSTSKPASGMCGECEATKTESKPAPAQPSRRELAESLLKTMVEWDMRSCTVKQQREFLDAIRMLKKEARQ